MVATLLTRAFRSHQKSTNETFTPRASSPLSEKVSSKHKLSKKDISGPIPIVLGPSSRAESETSSASGATFSSISEKEAGVLIPCGICRKSFDSRHPQALFAHLGGHFDQTHQFNRCEECKINFITEVDLQDHLHSASEHKKCGYMFQHRQPCTGHHPPRRRELKDDSRFDFCYRLQRWEGTQLEANRKAHDGSSLEVPASSTRTFSVSSVADIMRFSRLSRLPKVEDMEKALESTRGMSPEDALGAALLRAICTADVDLVACFLDAGANIGVMDALGFGVMHYNAQYGSPEIGWILMQAGANPNGMDRRGRSPLAHAISSRNTQLVHYFLAWGAQPGAHDLKAVVTSGNIENAEFLLEWWNHQGKPREALDSLLILAVKQQDRDIVEVLLDSGAKAAAKDEDGRSALSLAADANDRPITLLLLENGAEPDGWKQKDDRPLAEVVDFRNFATAEMLCAKVA